MSEINISGKKTKLPDFKPTSQESPATQEEIKEAIEKAQNTPEPWRKILDQETCLQDKRKWITKEIFIQLITGKANRGDYDHGVLADPKILTRDFNHFKGIAEIAAVVITSDEPIKAKG